MQYQICLKLCKVRAKKIQELDKYKNDMVKLIGTVYNAWD